MKKYLIIFVLILFIGSLSATTVYDIQYTTNAGDGTYPSPMSDQEVTVTGIVTANGFSGDKFFITDPGGGAWHGIYIFEWASNPAIGDEVEVTGTVSEYFGFTEIGYATVFILSNNNPVPEPVSVTTGDLASNEAYEGVLVKINNVTVVQELDEHSQWYVNDGSGDCQIDDGFFYLDDVDPPIVIHTGDTFEEIIGIVDYAYGSYGLNPRTPDDIIVNSSSDITIINSAIKLKGNYPNPFNPTTTISFTLSNEQNQQNEQTKLEIYNSKGQKIKTLIKEILPAGKHQVVWFGNDDNGKPVASGVYLYKIKSGRYTSTKKMILMK